MAPLFFATVSAHSFSGERQLRTLMAGTVSCTARDVTVRWGLEEAEIKVLARGTRSAYDAATSHQEGNKIRSPIAIRRAWK